MSPCICRFLTASVAMILLADVARVSAAEPITLSAGGCDAIVQPDTGGITSIKPAGRPGPEFLRPGTALGQLVLRVRGADQPWREMTTAASADVRTVSADPAAHACEVRYLKDSAAPAGLRDLDLVERFGTDGDDVRWTIELRNRASGPLEIGDLAVPLPMLTDYTKNTEETFTSRFYRHAFISGHGSFLFWMPTGGVGPHLLMLPEAGTSLEYFTDAANNYAFGGGDYRVYIHSAASGGETRGTWRQKHTSLTLQAGQKAVYGFRLRIAAGYAAIREALYQHKLFDIRVTPGMVVPEDLSATIALRTKNPIDSLAPEHPKLTQVEDLGEKPGGIHLYRIRFSRLGENLVTVHWGGGSMPLEFFVTEPLETLIQKRAAFIARNQQHRDPKKWYDGLFSLWDVRQPEGKNLLGPDHLAGQPAYAVSGSDDPSNSKCIYLSEKNVAWPDAKQVEALEYFIEHFVWGRHQRTDKEIPHPYGIYGCDNWQQCRTSPTGLNSGGHGQERMWRTFDYTTYFAMYYNMYRIAKQNPSMTHYLDAAGYLERAYGTARAFFEVPYNIDMRGWDFAGWCDWAFKIGNFHEKYLLGIIEALDREGRRKEADELRAQWEKKVRFFLCDDPYPWTSEMPVDSTAFESTWAIAKYALSAELPPVQNLWKDKKTGKVYSYGPLPRRDRESFASRQLQANIACRGWLETAYWQLGSDFRGCGSAHYLLSYMSQMGGWSILDQGLYFEPNPADFVQLGYASMLSSWALVNTGRPETNWGYWYPGQRHDGAVGWGFNPQKCGSEWNPAMQNIPRGPWPVDGEIDHGLAAGVEGACTVVLDDPIFGLTCLGGQVRENAGQLTITPRDGIRQRLHVLKGPLRLHISLDRDRFAADPPVRIAADGSRIEFTLETASAAAHTTTLTAAGLQPGEYELRVGNKATKVRVSSSSASFPIAAADRVVVRLQKQ